VFFLLFSALHWGKCKDGSSKVGVTVFTVLTDVAVRPPPVLEVMTLRFNRRLLFVDDEVSRSALVV
jgi:hypothetical protein